MDLPLADALLGGTAPDGGLFVPVRFPLRTPRPPRGVSLADSALEILAPFFAGDRLESSLPAMAAEAFTFPAPLVPLGGHDFVIELFHGPTAAFKDFGARFLAACVRRLLPPGHGTRTVLVATSGDTGSAVAAAFHGMRDVRVVLLYPDGRVSPRQAHQLGAFGDNVSALRVSGSFDECQAMVKAAFADPALATLRLTSANSISLGRLLPQLYREPGKRGRRGQGARARRPHRRHRPGDQRQPHAGGVLRGRRVSRAAERADARECDGRG